MTSDMCADRMHDATDDNYTANGISSASNSACAPAPTITTTPTTARNRNGNARSSAIELSENFYISNKRKNNVKIQVILNADGVYLRRETDINGHINEQLIRLEDIIGSRCGPRLKRARGGLISCKRLDDTVSGGRASASGSSSVDQKDTSAYLYIYAYVKSEKSSLRRIRTVRILRFRSYERYEENFAAAERWHTAICSHKGTFSREMQQKQLLILLNPKSGSGKGRELFHRQVVPVLREAEVQYDLHVTTHPNYARELMRQRQDLLQCYSGVVVASGDGLFYEVLNGLMERPDWRNVTRRLPIGIIPCGSGNGLAKSIAHLYNEPYEPKPILHATLTCISGNTTPMDVVRVEVGGGSKCTVMYSFISVGWGLIADVDIESERLRSLGAPRFTIWTIHRLISLRTYKGKLSYWPWRQELTAKTTSNGTDDAKLFTSNGTDDAKFFRLDSQEFHDILVPGEDDLPYGDDKFLDAYSLAGNSALQYTDSWHSAFSRRTAYFSIADQSMCSQRSTDRSTLSRLEAANAAHDAGGPIPTLPTLNTPLPTDGSWHSEEGEYVMVHAAYTTHLSSDVLFAPDSRLNDGIIYLVIIRGGVGRSQLLQFLLSLNDGTHLPEEANEHIQVVPVRAFRIEPASGKEGILAVDGERVPYGPIQAEVFPGIINVMVPNGKSI